MATHNAEILWAQRSSETEEDKNIIFLTVNLPNIIGEPELDITADNISFKARAGAADKGIPENTYAFSLPLFAPIDPALTKKSLSSRYLQLILRKAESKAEFWPRLTKDRLKVQWLKTDFSKWVDEDEQNEVPPPDESEFSGMGGQQGPPGGMPGGMPGMGGAGGLDMEALMAQMGGGAGGAGGPGGGMDFAKLMAQMGGGAGGPGGMPDFGAGGDSDDEAEEEEGEGNIPTLVDDEKDIEKVD
ncbi:HSP90 co-chaperone p23 [Phaffia rhodozyma]|uniref:HSP90 co-chaperone p23 n=1 Tax=Phaffia rhodozyma TaxID=264483 RepID=A0A0F7SJU3_PHARH|nr:HSP90 co-chaperone p23 [Phaffia rhodozyma]